MSEQKEEDDHNWCDLETENNLESEDSQDAQAAVAEATAVWSKRTHGSLTNWRKKSKLT